MEICPACAKQITSAFYTVGPRKFHTDCFRCSTCKAVLSTTFTERDGRLFCPEHSDLYSKCEGCGQLITETAIVVGQRRFHERCFTCATCTRPIGASSFVVDSANRPHCRACRPSESKASHCPCGRPLESVAINAMGQSWHPGCFVCAVCRTPLDGKEYTAMDGKPYCRRDNLIARGMLCKGCNDVIDDSQFTVAEGNKYHIRCFACSRCRLPIQNGENFFFSGGVPIHSHCDTCARCHAPLPPGGRYIDPAGPADKSICEHCARAPQPQASGVLNMAPLSSSLPPGAPGATRSIVLGGPSTLSHTTTPTPYHDSSQFNSVTTTAAASRVPTAAAIGATVTSLPPPHQASYASVGNAPPLSSTTSARPLPSLSHLPPPRVPAAAATAAAAQPLYPSSSSTANAMPPALAPAGSLPDIHAPPPSYAGARPSSSFARTPAEINLFFDSWIMSLQLARARLLSETVTQVDERGTITWDSSSSANIAFLQQARDKCMTICDAIHAEAPSAPSPRTTSITDTRKTTALPAATHAVSATAMAFGAVATRAEITDVAAKLTSVVDAMRQTVESTPQLHHMAVLFSRSQLSSSTPTLTIDLQALEATTRK